MSSNVLFMFVGGGGGGVCVRDSTTYPFKTDKTPDSGE